jgi:hypothetical protein
MRVSEYFKLGRTQAYLDFVDVRLETDIRVFLDPSAIKAMESPWGHGCASLLQLFFETVLKHIKAGNHDLAIKLLASLSERNEFHLGYSADESQGHAFGAESAESVWKALTKSKASASGLLQDLEDTCLLIRGIGPDMISDATCNILRGPLIKYTQDICAYYGIPLVPQVDSGPIWDPVAEKWDRKLLPLPVAGQYGKLVLVPKIMVRHQVTFQYSEYYNHYLLPQMQAEELQANSALVEVLKDGRKRVTKKKLKEKYGADKLSVVNETIKRPQILKDYREAKGNKPEPPLSHDEIADIEDTPPPDWKGLLKAIKALPVGKESASAYEDLVERLLSSLLYPSLCNPTKQHNIHNGRKRVDITYTNEAKKGFFAWVGQHHASSLVFVECKNYGKEIGNPELDQIAGRFSPKRGQVGILVCRKIEDKEKMMKRCLDTAHDHRGFVIPLDDDDLEEIVEAQLVTPRSQDFLLLRKLFTALLSD